MKPRMIAFFLVAGAVLALGCQAGDPTAPDSRGLELTKRGRGSGGGAQAVNGILSGGYTSQTAQPLILKLSASAASLETNFGAPIPVSLNVDTNDGDATTGLNQIPLSGEVAWAHCVWNADIAFPYDPAVVPQAARDLWDEVLGGFAETLERHYYAYVDLSAVGQPSAGHGTSVRWFTWEGRDKYMWEVEAGSETNLSTILATGNWDAANQVATISGGIVRATRTSCGRDPKPEGCKPSRGKDNRPTVVCRNDGAAFATVEFVTSLQ